MGRAQGTVAGMVLATALAFSSSASAAGPLYVSPGGSGMACTSVTPCQLAQALMLAGPGSDVVVALPGTYMAPSNAGFTVPNQVTLEGQAGQPRPTMFSLMFPTVTTGAETVLRHLHVEVVSGVGVQLGQDGTADDLDVQAVAPDSTGMSLASGDVVRDSLVTSGFQNAATSGGTGVVANDAATTLVGDTVLAGEGGTAIKATGVCPVPPGCGPGATAAAIAVRDTIARAGTTGTDLRTEGSNSALGTITVSHSAFRAGMTSAAGGPIDTSGGGNVGADPLFADRLTRDAHELPGSPTIDAGVVDPMLGATDFDGGARSLGAAPDIGADEYVPRPPAATTGAADGVSATGATLHGTVDLRGLAGTATFRWGTTSGYGRETSTVVIAPHDGPVPVSAPLSGLAPGTTFHFRLAASSSDGSAPGGDATFATKPAAKPKPPKPSLTKLKVLPGVFRKGRRSKISYRVSLAGRTMFRVERKAAGVRLKGRCRAVPRKKPRGKLKRCTRYVLLKGSRKHTDHAGANSWTFSGRIGGRALAVASYRLVATPKSKAGRTGAAKHAAFRIKR